jgi:tetratricopeptide (TPR) repeat protein
MKTLPGIVLVLFLATTTNIQAESLFCGKIESYDRYGPFDYRTTSKENLDLVESEHFTSDIKNLIKGRSGKLGSELNYTLHAFPNHHPALQAMAKLSLREKDTKPLDAEYTVECYFDRGIRFRPGDAIVRMLYGNYLLKVGGREDDAMEQYQEAIRIQPENANISYNLGLLYLKKKNYEQATEYAKKAYGLGFPLPGLRKKLMKMGKWDGKIDENVNEEKNESVDENE